MRVLLDERVNRKISRDIAGHEVRTVRQMGWTGLRNGALLRAAAEQADVLVTVDGSLPCQQNVAAHDIAASYFAQEAIASPMFGR